MKTLWIDTETTGLDSKQCAIIQISALVEIDGEVVAEFNQLLAPHRSAVIEQTALDINNRTVKEFKGFQTHQEAFNKFKNFMHQYVDPYDKYDKFVLAGYNIQFDLDFLSELFKRNNDKYIGAWIYRSFFDVLHLVGVFRYKGLIPPLDLQTTKLSDVSYYFGVEQEGFHDSLVDIKVTRNLALALFSEFENFKKGEKGGKH